MKQNVPGRVLYGVFGFNLRFKMWSQSSQYGRAGTMFSAPEVPEGNSGDRPPRIQQGAHRVAGPPPRRVS